MKTLNGQDLKRLFISASNNLYNHYKEVDALNVFPVPDGDTGINMSLTLTSGANDVSKLEEENNLYQISKVFSRGLLMGARGNSGVITSQIFRGFSQALEGKEEIDALDLAFAFSNGSKVAYKAVMRPVEGTILTVIRESSTHLSEQVNEKMNIEKALEIMLKEANASLARTPELLPILKEVGVVDSGGTGLKYILEGMYLASIGEDVLRTEDSKETSSNKLAQLEGEEYGYCTEFIMSLGPDTVKKPFRQSDFSNWLNDHGTSLVVVTDEDIVKVHVHTLTPGEILNYAQQYGEFLKLKIENMTEQHHALENGANVEVHEDLVPEEEKLSLDNEYALIAVSSGEGISNYFKELGISYVVSGGQSMNPSSEDFVSAIKKCNAKNIFILPNNSNIVMAAEQACSIVSSLGINGFVVPSKTIPQGIVAALSFSEDSSAKENFLNMRASLKNVKSGEVTVSIRDCELNGVHIEKDDFIGIFQKDIVTANKERNKTLIELLKVMIDEDSSLLTIFLGEGVSREDVYLTKREIEDLYPDLMVDIKEGNQPVYSFLVGVE